MSASAPPSKLPSPARTPRVSSSDERRKNNRPPGIINMGMTCFLNSTFQAVSQALSDNSVTPSCLKLTFQLAATPAVIALLSHNPAIPLRPAQNSILPPPAQDFRQTPCLDPNVLEPPLYGLLPVTRAFVNALYKNWTMKDNGGGISGPGSSSTVHSMSLRELLRELAKKYDQYQEFDQQDAHELLRHLLDSMEMEEKDVIKKQPASAVPPSVPGMGDPSTSPVVPTEQLMDEEQLLPFVDALFGGELSSVVVCETCKGVSHTYEGFLDISLSMRGHDDPSRQRKRDRFKGLFKPRTPSSRITAADSLSLSEPENSDGDSSSSRRLLGARLNDDGASVKRAASAKTGLGRKTSIFRRKGDRSVSRGARSEAASAPSTAVPTPTPGSPGAETPTSAITPTSYSHVPHPQQLAQQLHHVHQATPTAAQAAYIQRILYGPPAPPESSDPLAKLRAAHANGLTPNGSGETYGLIDALRSFTSVEILEGDNAFACHKCWKIKNGKYNRDKKKDIAIPATPASVASVGSIASTGSAGSVGSAASGACDSTHLAAPDVPTLAIPADGERSRSPFPKPSIARTASPLRNIVDLSSPREDIVYPDHAGINGRGMREGSDGAQSMSSVSSSEATDHSTAMSGTSPQNGFGIDGDNESDGLSDSSDDESEPDHEPASERKAFFRPSINRSKSSRQHKHFVLRKAFKRYLISRAPEVLVFHIKRFKQTSNGVYSTFSSLKK